MRYTQRSPIWLPTVKSVSQLITSLRVLSNADVMQVLEVRGVLYVEDLHGHQHPARLGRDI